MRRFIVALASLSLVAVVLVGLFAFGIVGVPRAVAASAGFISHHSAPRIWGRSNSTSTNWSGYATTGTTYSDVKGSWVEPTANCAVTSSGYSSFWVGIDGDGTNSVEQLGTDSDCSHGHAQYYGWWEMYPNPSQNLSTSQYPVSPGDALAAEVHYNGSGSYTLTMSSSRGWTFTTTQSTSAKNGSAEWIAEAPSSGRILPLADFGTVTFSNCTADGKVISANPNPDAITMTGKHNITKAKPSALNGSGNGFSVTWYHS